MIEVVTEIIGTGPIEVLDRELVDENPHRSRTAERYDVLEQSTRRRSRIFVKAGYDQDLRREISLYAGLFIPGLDPIPSLLGYKIIPGKKQVLVLDWLDGNKPRFTHEEDVCLVFQRLGCWSADLNGRLERYREGARAAFASTPNVDVERFVCRFLNQPVRADYYMRSFQEIATMAETDRHFVEVIGGRRLVQVLSELRGERISDLVEGIMSMPMSIDSGDVSINNVLLNRNSASICFLDFEFAKVRPISSAMEYVGDPYESVPQGRLSDLALESFVTGWNRESEYQIPHSAFRRSHACARVHHVGRDLCNSVRRIKAGSGKKHLPFAKQEAKALVQMLLELER